MGWILMAYSFQDNKPLFPQGIIAGGYYETNHNSWLSVFIPRHHYFGSAIFFFLCVTSYAFLQVKIPQNATISKTYGWWAFSLGVFKSVRCRKERERVFTIWHFLSPSLPPSRKKNLAFNWRMFSDMLGYKARDGCRSWVTRQGCASSFSSFFLLLILFFLIIIDIIFSSSCSYILFLFIFLLLLLVLIFVLLRLLVLVFVLHLFFFLIIIFFLSFFFFPFPFLGFKYVRWSFNVENLPFTFAKDVFFSLNKFKLRGKGSGLPYMHLRCFVIIITIIFLLRMLA